jgi:hypothetical protein
MTTKKQLLTEIVEFMVKSGLATSAQVCEIVLLPSARASACVHIKGAESLFVKKLIREQAVGDFWLDQKISSLPFLQNNRAQTVWNKRGWYVSEYFANYNTLKATDGRCFLASEAHEIGAFLGRLHSQHLEVSVGVSGLGANPQQHVLPMRALSIDEYSKMPGLDRDIYIRVCQQAGAGLDLLSGRLSKICIVHGDFQGNNILLSTLGDGQIRVVDWEASGLGDPAWDLGHLMAALLQYWVHRLKLNTASVVDAFAVGQGSWSRLAEWFEGAVKSYQNTVNADVFNQLDMGSLFQVAGYAMIQRCRNILHVYGRFSQKDLLLLSIAERLISEPSQAIDALTPTLAGWKGQ